MSKRFWDPGAYWRQPHHRKKEAVDMCIEQYKEAIVQAEDPELRKMFWEVLQLLNQEKRRLQKLEDTGRVVQGQHFLDYDFLYDGIVRRIKKDSRTYKILLVALAAAIAVKFLAGYIYG